MKLADYLKEFGRTQSDFADRIGVSQAMVNGYLKKGNVPRPSIMKKIVTETKGAVQPQDFYEISEAAE